MIEIYPTLYKRDSNGNIREWRLERQGAEYRTVSGVQNGQAVTSEWKSAEAKGIGKAHRDAETQAQMEITSIYKKRLENDYHESIHTIDQPIRFNPMLAAKYEGWVGACYSQPKLDGIRCIANSRGLWSRNGKPILGAPHIYDALVEFFQEYPDAILDGELYNHQLKDNFNQIVSCVKKQKPTPEELKLSAELVEYHVYDLPSSEGVFGTRYSWLFDNLPSNDQLGLEFNTCIELVGTIRHHTELDLDETYALFLENGYEGQMVRLDVPYENKRTKALLKRKEFIDEEFPLVSINEGIGNWGGVAKSVTCSLPNGDTFNAGIKGNWEAGKELLGKDAEFSKVTVRYQNLTPDGIPRFGIAVKFWDKEAAALDRA
jgi:DNA ligase-1